MKRDEFDVFADAKTDPGERVGGLIPQLSPVWSCRMKFFTRFGAMPARESANRDELSGGLRDNEGAKP